MKASPFRPDNSSGRYQERRAAPRKRRGIRVLFLSNDSALDEPFGGTLLDASPGGVRLAIRLADIPQDAVLLVRPPAAPAGTPWMPVRVRNLRLFQDQWELGCQFTDALPTKMLTLFAS